MIPREGNNRSATTEPPCVHLSLSLFLLVPFHSPPSPYLLTPPPTSLCSYSITKVLNDHDQAIRTLALLPGQDGFVSAGNDGAIKVRQLDGSVRFTFLNPLNMDGRPYSVFHVKALPGGSFASCNEDNALRLYSEDGAVEEVLHPGTVWNVARFSNGDLATACAQAGTSKKGHVYCWTRDVEARGATDMELATLSKDMAPPKQQGGARGGAGGVAEGIKAKGPYEHRAGYPGTKEGQYGFFSLPDGGIMACMWNSADREWTDLGQVQDGPAGGEGSSAAAGGAGAGDEEGGMMLEMGGASGGAGGPGGAGASDHDFVCSVTADTPSGMRSLQLCFNEEDDPISVAKTFVAENGLSADSYEEVRRFIIQKKGERAKQRQQSMQIKQYRHFPTQVRSRREGGRVRERERESGTHLGSLEVGTAGCHCVAVSF